MTYEGLFFISKTGSLYLEGLIKWELIFGGAYKRGAYFWRGLYTGSLFLEGLINAEHIFGGAYKQGTYFWRGL